MTFFLQSVFLIILHCQLNRADNPAVTVHFNHMIRHYGPEPHNSYTRQDLGVMIGVVSTRFQSILMSPIGHNETLPLNSNSSSILRIPSVVAEHNKNLQDNPSKRLLRVTISIDFVWQKYVSNPTTAFFTAQYLANSANSIYPGTVSTLLLHTGDYTFFKVRTIHHVESQVINIRQQMNQSGNMYELGFTTELKGCKGNFLEENVAASVKKILPHVDLIVLNVHLSLKRHGISVSARDSHKIFDTEFDDCEKSLQEVKKDIKVVPLVYCLEDFGTVESSWLQECWKLMTDWAKENNKEVIMYGAFDSPDAVHTPRKSGWWRLKSVAESVISESIFVEKINDIPDKVTNSSGSGAVEEQGKSLHVLEDCEQRMEYYTGTKSKSSSAARTAVTLLAIICGFIFVVDCALVWSLARKKNLHGKVLQWRARASNHRRFGRGGSTMEIREDDHF